jgi:uncharacterized protein (TIGR00730 family)
MKNITNKINLSTFCSSKSNLNQIYYSQTQQMISKLNPSAYSIVYGGGTGGIMGTVRKSWLDIGGTIISSNIDRFVEDGIVDDYLFDNIIDRQKKLVELGDGYLIFPGGYGTHYETLEVITKNDIGEASKPIFILNINGIFDNFISQIDLLIKEKFITKNFSKLNIFVETNPDKLVEIIDNFYQIKG